MRPRRAPMYGDCRGYTLIELAMVVLILGVLTGLVSPRFRSAILSDPVKAEVRLLAGMIREGRSEAVRRQEPCDLFFDLDAGEAWMEFRSMDEEGRRRARRDARRMRPGVHLEVVLGPGKAPVAAGLAAIRFTPRGYAAPALLRVTGTPGRAFTLAVSPFLPRVALRAQQALEG